MRALVVKSTGLWYEVMNGNKRITARLRGKFKLEGKKLTNPVIVGDWVEIEPNGQVVGEWVITKITKRDNYVIRESSRKKGHDHMMASNVEQAVLIATLKKPRTSTGFIDRFLITLETFRIKGVIIFNKQDLYSKKEFDKYDKIKSIYTPIGYEVYLCQLNNSLNDEIRSIFKGKRSLISGHSGVGKSTLINQLIPGVKQEVNEVSHFSDKGVHTTTFTELFFMDNESTLIDTPGIKELGLSEVGDEELSHYFPEIRKYLNQCKFHNCLHVNEPECKIRQAVGVEISTMRYENYLSILRTQKRH